MASRKYNKVQRFEPLIVRGSLNMSGGTSLLRFTDEEENATVFFTSLCFIYYDHLIESNLVLANRTKNLP